MTMLQRANWLRYHYLITTSSLLVLLSVSGLSAEPPWASRGSGTSDVRKSRSAEEGGNGSAKEFRLNYLTASWSTVLHDLAETTGTELVMDKVPPGRFSRRDRTRYSRSEAIRILNHDLEPIGYRLLDKGKYIIVLHLKSARSRYQRPVISSAKKDPERKDTERKDTARRLFSRHNESERNENPITMAHASSVQNADALRGQADSIRQVAHAKESPVELPAANAVIPVRLQYQNATNVLRTIYQVFKARSDLIEDGPDHLPAVRVLSSELQLDDMPQFRQSSGPAQKRAPAQVLFEIGINSNSNDLVVAAQPARAQALARLIHGLDTDPVNPEQTIQLVSSENDSTHIAQHLQPALKRLILPPSGPKAPLPSRSQSGGRDNRMASAWSAEAAAGAEEKPADPEVKTDSADGEAIIGGLKGEVSIEYVPGVGFVLRGNEEDVKKVEDIIRLIEKMSIGTAPDIEVHLLKHVNSEALAELLTSVYEELGEARDELLEQTTNISILPVVKPNAILIIASATDMKAILELVERLDQPVDPRIEFTVFSLKNAIASQVVTTLDSFYPDDPGGLGPRVSAVADVRTNSIIVQAEPRDMEEVARLIEKIDQDHVDAVNDIRFFPLKNAVAEELAELINEAIQSVLNPPSSTGQLGGQFGASGRSSQELRDAKSAVLQFLAMDGEKERMVRSGILADIRVTADPRTNSLVITAPKQSMELMAALITRFDQPSDHVAEIKVFALENADATTVAELLADMFEDQAQQSQTAQLGVQLAGATEAASNLIPLRFTVDVRTNSVIAVGGAEALELVDAILLRLDVGDLRKRQSTVIKLKNSFAPDVAESINDFRDSLRDLQTADPDLISPYELLEQEIVVIADEATNNLIISATPKYFDEVEKLVNQLDAAPKQVIIQALLVEVVLENTDEFGVELGFQDSVLFNRSLVENISTISKTEQTAGNNQVVTETIVSSEGNPGFLFNVPTLGNNTLGDAAKPGTVGTQGLSSFTLGRTNGELGFGGLVLSAGSESVSVLLRALSQQRHVEVLSRPQIRTLDNQFSMIHVGQTVPRITDVSVDSQTGNTSPVLTDTDVGLVLEVTPRISPDGIIVMEVVATKSELSGEGVPLFSSTTVTAMIQTIESPIIDTATAQTTVAVPNGQTIVLGGMITSNDQTIERKVPWLGDIPIIKHAFRFESSSSERHELLIFLTPRIIDSDEDAEMIKQIEMERIHFCEEKAEEIHGPLYSVPEMLQFDSPPGDSQLLSPPPAPAADQDASTTFMPGDARLPEFRLDNAGAAMDEGRSADGEIATAAASVVTDRGSANDFPYQRKPNRLGSLLSPFRSKAREAGK